MSGLSPAWKKSTRSYDNGACVEVRVRSSQVEVRDSKNPRGPSLSIPPAAWQQFVQFVKEDG